MPPIQLYFTDSSIIIADPEADPSKVEKPFVIKGLSTEKVDVGEMKNLTRYNCAYESDDDKTRVLTVDKNDDGTYFKMSIDVKNSGTNEEYVRTQAAGTFDIDGISEDIFEQELNTLGKLLITENIQVVSGIAHIVFRAILLLHLNLVVAVPVLTLRTIAESDRVTLEPNFSKLVGHPASDKEIRINRGNHRCENALHLMFTSTTALDSTAGSSRHTRLSCMLTFLENTGSHNRLLSMVQNIPVRIRCNESMCRRT